MSSDENLDRVRHVVVYFRGLQTQTVDTKVNTKRSKFHSLDTAYLSLSLFLSLSLSLSFSLILSLSLSLSDLRVVLVLEDDVHVVDDHVAVLHLAPPVLHRPHRRRHHAAGRHSRVPILHTFSGVS